MKFSSIIAVLAIFGVVSTTSAISLKNKVETAQTEKHFQNFISKYQRNYKTNAEYTQRLANFAKNMDIVNSHNADSGNTFTLELNKFADLSNKEFQSMLGFRADLINDDSNNDAQVDAELEEMQSYPTSLDWRQQPGIVAPMKNQGSCGSCYAFASMEALQSAYHIKKGAFTNGTVINLSEQQVVDCSGSYGNQGCNGGLMEYVYNYLKATPSMLEGDYPYRAVRSTCRSNTSKGMFKVTSYSMIARNNPNAHVAALQTGPVTIALAAGSSAFQLYRSGVLNSSSCGTVMNHAVTLIGYGTENGTPYWLVKNSWGTYWGEQGFIKIYRDMAGTGSGMCGLLQHSVQPTGINV